MESSEEPTIINDLSIEPTNDELINEQLAESTNEPLDLSTNEPFDEPTNETLAETTNEPLDFSTNEPFDEPTNEPHADTINEPLAEATNDPRTEPTNDPLAEPINKPFDESKKLATTEPTTEQAKSPGDTRKKGGKKGKAKGKKRGKKGKRKGKGKKGRLPVNAQATVEEPRRPTAQEHRESLGLNLTDYKDISMTHAYHFSYFTDVLHHYKLFNVTPIKKPMKLTRTQKLLLQDIEDSFVTEQPAAEWLDEELQRTRFCRE